MQRFGSPILPVIVIASTVVVDCSGDSAAEQDGTTPGGRDIRGTEAPDAQEPGDRGQEGDSSDVQSDNIVDTWDTATDATTEPDEPSDVPPPLDVTDALETLGNPTGELYTGERAYARNVWDLCAFEGRIYVGAGNSSNVGPASNAGPVPLFAYDLETDDFVQEYLVEDEQIDIYCIFDGILVTPGHDPREGWGRGTFYRRSEDGSWEKTRNIPNAVHTYAMALHDERLFAALGTMVGSAAAVSNTGARPGRSS